MSSGRALILFDVDGTLLTSRKHIQRNPSYWAGWVVGGNVAAVPELIGSPA